MSKTLLVLGNGFDLYCGLKSTFKEYITSEYNKTYYEIVKVVDRVINQNFTVFSKFLGVDINGLNESLDKLTFWDLYFTIPVIENFSNISLWYDFEKKLQKFIRERGVDEEYYRVISLGRKILNNGIEYDAQSVYEMSLYLYLALRLESKDLYSDLSTTKTEIVLFEDLKKYERRFGGYIQHQQTNFRTYGRNALTLIGNLLDDSDELTYINTFNYSDLSKLTEYTPVWHINGDAQCPIFGVDYNDVDTLDIRYKYTKTFRRLELDKKLHPRCCPVDKDYSKVVVFGHSLNEQDYNYFYALFNSLGLNNESGRRKEYMVEFAYSPHGDQTSEEARISMVSRALKLLQQYDFEILRANSFRLMDILYLSGAISFREIPGIESKK